MDSVFFMCGFDLLTGGDPMRNVIVQLSYSRIMPVFNSKTDKDNNLSWKL